MAHFHRLTPAIVHRDLKPNNILVDRISKRVKITDFGIGAVAAKAALAGEASGTTTRVGRATSFLRGAHTPLYASPQQRNGDAPDPRDDVHALGVIAYQLLTGQLTQAPGTDFGHDLREIGVNTELITLIGACVSHNPARRPADADELLRRVLALPSTPAKGDSTPSVAPAYSPSASPPSANPSAMLSGYVRCPCCNLPIPVTSDDVGLTVTCPRTHKLVAVKATDLGGGAVPQSKSSTPSPRPNASPARKPVTPSPGGTGADEADDDMPRLRKRKWNLAPVLLVGVLGLVALISLGGVAWKLSRTGPLTVKAISSRQPDPKAGTPGTSPPVVVPAPPPDRPRGTVTPPVIAPPGGTPPAPAPVVPPELLAPKTAAVVVAAVEMVADAALQVAAEAALDSHIKASNDPDAAARRTAVERLAAFLTSPDELLRRKAVARLAELGADAAPAAPALQAALKDPDGDVRKSARLALEKIDEAAVAAKAAKTREAILALAKDLKAKEPAKRIKALDQIAVYGPEANVIGEQLIEAMADTDLAVRDAASGSLEKVNPAVHPHVFTILRGMKKREAIDELGKLGNTASIAVPLLLYCQINPRFWFPASPDPNYFDELVNLFPVIAKIAPNDKRFASAVLGHIAGTVTPPEVKNKGFVRMRRQVGLAQLKVIEAEPADKVKALIAALGDDQATVAVIAALQDCGKAAEPALPLLKKLKLSSDDAIRNAAIKAIEKIE